MDVELSALSSAFLRAAAVVIIGSFLAFLDCGGGVVLSASAASSEALLVRLREGGIVCMCCLVLQRAAGFWKTSNHQLTDATKEAANTRVDDVIIDYRS